MVPASTTAESSAVLREKIFFEVAAWGLRRDRWSAASSSITAIIGRHMAGNYVALPLRNLSARGRSLRP